MTGATGCGRRAASVVAAAAAGALACASPAFGAGMDAGGISADGGSVFFRTSEQMVPADTDAENDVYMRSGGVTSLISAPGAGASTAAQGASFNYASADGSVVVFSTQQSLVAADTDLAQDVYMRAGGVTSLASGEGPGASGPTAINASAFRLSDDGSRVFFITQQNLVGADTDGLTDVYAGSGGAPDLVSAPGAGASGADFAASFAGITPDGLTAYFNTTQNMLAADTDGLRDLYQRSGGTTTLVSEPGAGATPPSQNAFQASGSVSSADGSRVFFETTEQMVGADTDSSFDLYERSAGDTTLVSAPGAGASGPEDDASMDRASSDGSRVFFETEESLVTADTDTDIDIYERSAGTTTLASAPGAGASGPSSFVDFAALSDDGTRMFFVTVEKLVTADVHTGEDIYQRSGGVTTLVSAPGIGAFGPPSDPAFPPEISSDGSRVFFETDQSMVGEDTDGGLSDIYERSVGFTTRASVPGAGAATDAPVNLLAPSDDGSRVFMTTAARMVGADTDTDTDIYQRSGGVTTLVTEDEVPPQTTITASPKAKLTAKKKTVSASFSFSSSEAGSSFQCSLDGAAFAACTSPRALKLKPGTHTFRVRALDTFANLDASPASGSVKVVKKKRKRK